LDWTSAARRWSFRAMGEGATQGAAVPSTVWGAIDMHAA
jgi:hypothetical protein